VIEQGVEMGRASEVHVMLNCEGTEPRTLRIGGTCVWMGQGEIHVFPDDAPPSSVD
jgi:predicted PhzF superfamily epimerase YddE/YHI9